VNHKILVIGIGNSSRSDDGLGWKFLESLPEETTYVNFQYRFQLQVEDADLIKDYGTVVFVDATEKTVSGGFQFSSCDPVSFQDSFTSHRLEPAAVLWLCNEIYGSRPDAYLMAIGGSTWELKEGLSPGAINNLNKALSYFHKWWCDKFFVVPVECN
jgi:hydrogenase maturation protease